jgi:hypothetical protein
MIDPIVKMGPKGKPHQPAKAEITEALNAVLRAQDEQKIPWIGLLKEATRALTV